MALSVLNQVSIAEICIYVPALFIGIYLSMKHGFGRSSGWLFLIIFSLIRLIGAALELATISNPTNINLYIGANILQNVGLSPLILIMLGLLSRVVQSISFEREALVTPRNLRIVQTLTLIGLILGIVGGSQASDSIVQAQRTGASNSSYETPTTSVAGLALMIAGYGLLVLATIRTAMQIRFAEDGEKRILLGIAAALPFVLVRIVYSALATFTKNSDFRAFGNSPHYVDYLIGMSIAMEMIAIAIFEAVGLTLRRLPKGDNSIPMGVRRNQADQV